MTSPRVVHVVVAGEVGGAERMLVDLAADEQPGEVSHAVALFTPNPRLRELFLGAGLRVHDRGAVREDAAAYLWRAFGPTELAWLRGVLELERADIVQTHTFGSQALAARAAHKHRARLVRTEHSTRVYQDARCWWLSRPSLLQAHAVVAISAHVSEVARARLPTLGSRLRVIHNGVDTERHRPSEAQRDAALPFTFVLVARLEPRKAVDQALHALRAVPGAHLVVVGDGVERARLQALARALSLDSRVRFVGEQRDPRPFVRDADAALSSSRQEGLSLALLEGMAQGLPAVALPVGGIPEFVRDGDNGWLAAAPTVAALAAAMRAASAAPPAEARARGARARAFVERSFSREAMRAAWSELYHELISQGGS